MTIFSDSHTHMMTSISSIDEEQSTSVVESNIGSMDELEENPNTPIKDRFYWEEQIAQTPEIIADLIPRLYQERDRGLITLVISIKTTLDLVQDNYEHPWPTFVSTGVPLALLDLILEPVEMEDMKALNVKSFQSVSARERNQLILWTPQSTQHYAVFLSAFNLCVEMTLQYSPQTEQERETVALLMSRHEQLFQTFWDIRAISEMDGREDIDNDVPKLFSLSVCECVMHIVEYTRKKS